MRIGHTSLGFFLFQVGLLHLLEHHVLKEIIVGWQALRSLSVVRKLLFLATERLRAILV